MLEVKNLSKKYGNKVALSDINFSVKDGEILGFLGPNGAGKSTTMNIITGYISSTTGTVTVDGDEIMENPIAVKRKIGYLPEQLPLYLDMTVKAYLDFMYDLKKIKLNKKQHIEEICRLVKIDDVYQRVIKHLSKGYKQRVGIAQALLGEPELLILDEPTVGLDPNQIIEIRNLIKSLGEKHTIILSSHVLSEIQSVCDRVIVINNGKVVADDTTANLSSGLSSENRLILTIEGEQDVIISALKEISGITDVKISKTNADASVECVVNYDKTKDVRKAVFSKMAAINCPIISMSNDNMTLEDIFRKLTNENESGNDSENAQNSPVNDTGNAQNEPVRGSENPASELVDAVEKAQIEEEK